MSDVKFNKPVSNNESGVLAKLWRQIMIETGAINAVDLMINRYVDKSNDKTANMLQIKKKTKSTLITNIGSSEMTWKVFLDLLFNFLRVVRVSISIKLTYANGNESVHSLIVNNSVESDKTQKDKDEKGVNPKSD